MVGQEPKASAADAWEAWKKGDVEEALKTAEALAESAERTHLLFLCAHVKGEYEKAIGLHAEIDGEYGKLDELDEPMVQSYLHLNRAADALAFLEMPGKTDKSQKLAELQAKSPLKVTLKKITEIPFAKHQLTRWFPAFKAELEGEDLTVHIDTGGTFLIMGPGRAKKLGIELHEAGMGHHGSRAVKMSVGIAKKFALGDAVLENVPVATLASLKGPQDFVIFGTNIFEQFLSTMDYPNQRLILSPRGNEKETKKHMKMLEGDRTEVPYFMWGDHYMFARGGFGEHKDLNFFVDSGLVAIDPTNGRQACFMSSAKLYKKWGVDAELVKKRFFETPVPISLGPLEQKNQYFMPTKSPVSTLGGVRIDGLLSHGFLCKYSWTLDFDRRVYVFAQKKD
jgi:hypothetical protein